MASDGGGEPARRTEKAGVPEMDNPLPPGISFGDAFKAFTPPGADPAALMEALKASRWPTIALPPSDEDARYFSLCPRCDKVHDSRGTCGDGSMPMLRQEMLADEPPPGGCYFPLTDAEPADPFTPADLRATALSQFWHEMTEAGIPAENVDRIIGVMLAEAHGKPE